jgi:hypothetical protein
VLAILAACCAVPAAPARGDDCPPTERCPQGLVWREAFPGDFVCVPEATRTQAADDNREAAARREPGPGAYGPDSCLLPFVWRGAFAGDVVCVTVPRRDQVAADNRDAHLRRQIVGTRQGVHYCKQGFVWREARPEDLVCVTPEERERVRAENRLAASRRGNSTCRPPFVWREAGPDDFVCVTVATRAQAAADNRQECVVYARTAMRQQCDNLRSRCGFTGDRWSFDYDGHYAWCTAAEQRSRDVESGGREAAITACRNPRPTPTPGWPPSPAPTPPGGPSCCWLGAYVPGVGIVNTYQCGPTCPCGTGGCR